jgi:hypothetical protein
MKVTIRGTAIPEAEINEYVKHVQEENPNRDIDALEIELEPDGENVDLKYTLVPVQFERIRRITGYLVGSMDRWNNSKRAEEHDRVKHST